MRSRWASVSPGSVTAPASPRSSVTALRSSARRSSSVSGSSVSSSERESSGEMIEKYGFSVVAAISVTQRFSTAGSSESCWALLKRWISSRNSTVSRPYIPDCCLALSMTARTSFTPAVIADSSTNRFSVAWLTTYASVVLPVPGGPQRITDDAPAGPLPLAHQPPQR